MDNRNFMDLSEDNGTSASTVKAATEKPESTSADSAASTGAVNAAGSTPSGSSAAQPAPSSQPVAQKPILAEVSGTEENKKPALFYVLVAVLVILIIVAIVMAIVLL